LLTVEWSLSEESARDMLKGWVLKYSIT